MSLNTYTGKISQRNPKMENIIHIKCLAFAGDIFILSNTREETQQAKGKFHEIANKTGHQNLYDKTQFFHTKSSDKRPLKKRNGKVLQESMSSGMYVK